MAFQLSALQLVNINATVWEKVRTLRKRRGLSLRKLASMLGLATHSHLDRIERGEKRLSADLILKIADIFEVSTAQLMRDELELDE